MNNSNRQWLVSHHGCISDSLPWDEGVNAEFEYSDVKDELDQSHFNMLFDRDLLMKAERKRRAHVWTFSTEFYRVMDEEYLDN
jgi:hypothetical protein